MLIAKVLLCDLIDAPEFPGLIAEYARESATIEGLPTPEAKLDNYRILEMGGMLHVFTATAGPELVGFLTVLIHGGLHYSVPLAVTESFFVTEDHRKGGTGLRLLAAAEELAQELGSPVLLVCAPFGGRLFEILPRRGYVETNRVFAKRVGHVH